MDELCRAVSRGEQCLGYQVFQAAVKECQSGRDGEEEIATAVRGTPELQSLKEEGCVASSRETTSENCRGPSSKEVKTAGVEVALENRELWRQFDRITNEMIVTKAGRYLDLGSLCSS